MLLAIRSVYNNVALLPRARLSISDVCEPCLALLLVMVYCDAFLLLWLTSAASDVVFGDCHPSSSAVATAAAMTAPAPAQVVQATGSSLCGSHICLFYMSQLSALNLISARSRCNVLLQVAQLSSEKDSVKLLVQLNKNMKTEFASGPKRPKRDWAKCGLAAEGVIGAANSFILEFYGRIGRDYQLQLSAAGSFIQQQRLCLDQCANSKGNRWHGIGGQKHYVSEDH